jgi:hypothetical protein
MGSKYSRHQLQDRSEFILRTEGRLEEQDRMIAPATALAYSVQIAGMTRYLAKPG